MNQLSAKTYHSFLRMSAALCAPVLMALAACSSTPNVKDPVATRAKSVESWCEAKAESELTQHGQRALLAAGYRALQQRDLACAERLTQLARQRDSSDPYAALNLGAIYQRQGRLIEARRQYESAIQLEKALNKSDPSTEATDDRSLQRSPGEIAKRNLAALDKS